DFIAGVFHAFRDWEGDRYHELVGRQDMLAFGRILGGLEELRQLYLTLALRPLNLGLGAEGNQAWRERGRIDDDARVPLGEDRGVAIFAVEGKALVAAFQEADGGLVAEVPAAVALAEVAAEGAHVADLRAADVAGRHGQCRHELLQLRML